jgi:hypothetical protein
MKSPLRFQELFEKAASPRREMAGWVLLLAESSWWGDSASGHGCPRVRASAGKVIKIAKPDPESLLKRLLEKLPGLFHVSLDFGLVVPCTGLPIVGGMNVAVLLEVSAGGTSCMAERVVLGVRRKTKSDGSFPPRRTQGGLKRFPTESRRSPSPSWRNALDG